MSKDGYGILLVAEDDRFLTLMAAELRSMGCRVVCAQNMEQAIALVRAGVMKRFVIVRLDDQVVPSADLRDEFAAHLPGWVVEPDEMIEAAVEGRIRGHRQVN